MPASEPIVPHILSTVVVRPGAVAGFAARVFPTSGRRVDDGRRLSVSNRDGNGDFVLHVLKDLRRANNLIERL